MSKQVFPIHDVASRKVFVETMLQHGTMTFTRMEGTQWGIGIMTFPDGWSVQGSSVCVNPADYNEAIGTSIAHENCKALAETHYWRTVGYLAMIGMTEIEVPFNVEVTQDAEIQE